MAAVSQALDQRGGGEQRGRALATAPNAENIKNLQRTIAQYRGTFDRLLPSHMDAETFIGIAAGALWKNQDLAAAALSNPDSFLVALRDCARLGHQPGTDEYALTVRKVNKQPSVLGIEQYQGVIERMYRGGAVVAVHAQVVCGGERFIPTQMGPPQHIVEDWLNRDTTTANLIGAYAYAVLEGGVCSQVVFMGKAEIMRHREVAATVAIWDGPFGKSMWLKTVVHELEKWVPTSSEYRREQARAAAELQRAMQQQTPPAPSQPPAEPMPDRNTVDGSYTVHDEPPNPDGIPVEDPPAGEWPPTAQPPAGGDQ